MTFCHHYKTSSELQGWQCSVLSLTTVWPQPTMWTVYWQHVRGYYMLCECCTAMVCQHHQCTMCSGCDCQAYVLLHFMVWILLGCGPYMAGHLSMSLSMTQLLQQWHSNCDGNEEKADDKLFCHVLANDNHVLQQHLPEWPNSQYNTRTRTHNKTLITKTTDLNDRDFFNSSAVQSHRLCKPAYLVPV